MMQHIAPEIVERVNRFFGYGAISRVSIRQGDVAAPRPRPAPPSLKPIPVELGASLRTIADPELKAVLEALAAGRRSNARRPGGRTGGGMTKHMMRYLLALVALVAGFGSIAMAAGRDWTGVVTKSANGSFVIGNRNAKVKLVEYVGDTCPHCAHFIAESGSVLRGQMVRSGSTSVELRNAVRDWLDLTAAQLARCTGPKGVLRDDRCDLRCTGRLDRTRFALRIGQRRADCRLSPAGGSSGRWPTDRG